MGMPFKRVCFDPKFNWVFDGIEGDILGDFGFSGGGAAGLSWTAETLNWMEVKTSLRWHRRMMTAQFHPSTRRNVDASYQYFRGTEPVHQTS